MKWYRLMIVALVSGVILGEEGAVQTIYVPYKDVPSVMTTFEYGVYLPQSKADALLGESATQATQPADWALGEVNLHLAGAGDSLLAVVQLHYTVLTGGELRMQLPQGDYVLLNANIDGRLVAVHRTNEARYLVHEAPKGDGVISLKMVVAGRVHGRLFESTVPLPVGSSLRTTVPDGLAIVQLAPEPLHTQQGTENTAYRCTPSDSLLVRWSQGPSNE